MERDGLLIGPYESPDSMKVCEEWARGAIHQFLRIILNIRILVLLPVSTLPYVDRVKNSSLIGE
jgi:hypothetical protein